MNFGTKFLENNYIEFKFWATDCKKINLCIKNQDGSEFTLPMDYKGDNWFVLVTDKAKVGSKYLFQLDTGMFVPDPAARFQAEDVHGASIVVNPDNFNWGDDSNFVAKKWHETVVYEIHTGTFSNEGTFAGVKKKLDYLVDLGVTAIEIMPVADFPGKRNWGYDGVLIYAPDNTYGTPEDLKDLIKAAHQKGLSVMLDVVYNHLGPEGNYFYVYSKSHFFDKNTKNAWGDAINFGNKNVRDFFVQNALYWLEEYHFDGIRFDAVHGIKQDFRDFLLDEIFNQVKQKINREVYLVLENDDNQAKYLNRYNAQWVDDFHHSAYSLVASEKESYYVDFSNNPAALFARTIAEGFAYQGEKSIFRGGMPRGEDSKGLPVSCFQTYLQNHDIVANRIFSRRIHEIIDKEALNALNCINLLNPSVPLLFMGEEFSSKSPFYFFCDFEEQLNLSVKEGRLQEFSGFSEFFNQALLEKIPCVTTEQAFLDSKLDWDFDLQKDETLKKYKEFLLIRKKHIIPLIPEIIKSQVKYEMIGDSAFSVTWATKSGKTLELLTNLGEEKLNYNYKEASLIAESRQGSNKSLQKDNILEAYCTFWFLR
jgi:malto-oligosyltrehalose trehalohydrolase